MDWPDDRGVDADPLTVRESAAATAAVVAGAATGVATDAASRVQSASRARVKLAMRMNATTATAPPMMNSRRVVAQLSLNGGTGERPFDSISAGANKIGSTRATC